MKTGGEVVREIKSNRSGIGSLKVVFKKIDNEICSQCSFRCFLSLNIMYYEIGKLYNTHSVSTDNLSTIQVWNSEPIASTIFLRSNLSGCNLRVKTWILFNDVKSKTGFSRYNIFFGGAWRIKYFDNAGLLGCIYFFSS